MARPLSDSIPYFPHDTDMSEDEKIQKLEFKYGLEGYAIFNKILERVYKTSGTFNLETDDDFKMYAEKWRVENAKLREIILFMREIKLFCDEKLISNGIKKRIRKIQTERSRKRKYYKNKAVKKTVLDGQNTGDRRIKSGFSTQSKEKKRKVKESIYNDDEDFEITEQDCIKLWKESGYPDAVGKKYYNHYAAKNWIVNGDKIENIPRHITKVMMTKGTMKWLLDNETEQGKTIEHVT
jgi:hypothetical protein